MPPTAGRSCLQPQGTGIGMDLHSSRGLEPSIPQPQPQAAGLAEDPLPPAVGWSPRTLGY